MLLLCKKNKKPPLTKPILNSTRDSAFYTALSIALVTGQQTAILLIWFCIYTTQEGKEIPQLTPNRLSTYTEVVDLKYHECDDFAN